MFSQLKHTFKQTAIYSLGNISTKLIGFILLPIYTNPKYLSVSDYGIWATLEVTSQIMIGVIALNLPIAMLRWASGEKNERKFKSIVFTTIFGLILITLASLLFLLPNSAFASRLIFGSEKFSEYFSLLFIYVAVGIYNGVPLNILRLKEKSVFYVITTSLKFALILSLNIFFVVYRHEGVEGIIKGQLLGEFFLSLATLKIVLSSIAIKIDYKALKEMLKYGTPLVLSTISSFILSFGDRYILLHFLDEAKVGIYSLGYKIASVINMLILQSFQLGFLPIAYKKLDDADAGEFLSKVLTYYTIVLTFTALAISSFGFEIVKTFARTSAFYPAILVIPLISLAFVFKGVQYNFALSFHYAKKTIYNALVVVITAVISLTLNFILIPQIGIYGSALSMLISIFVMMILSYFLGRKIYSVPFEVGKIIKIITPGIILFLISAQFNDYSLTIRIFVKISTLIIFPTLLIPLKVINKKEIFRLKNLM